MKEMNSVDILIQECNWSVTGLRVERILLIAMLDGIIAGSSAIKRDMNVPDDLLFESTFVGEVYRKAGIATILNERRLEIADQFNAKRIWGTVYRGNRFYLRWFMERGFKIHSKDPVNDTFRMLKDLSTLE